MWGNIHYALKNYSKLQGNSFSKKNKITYIIIEDMDNFFVSKLRGTEWTNSECDLLKTQKTLESHYSQTMFQQWQITARFDSKTSSIPWNHSICKTMITNLCYSPLSLSNYTTLYLAYLESNDKWYKRWMVQFMLMFRRHLPY